MSSPITLAIINQKGGVGKTTTVINLAASLSIMGRNNLIIDLDPQGNATTGLGKNNNDEDKNVYNLLIKKTNIENIIQQTDIKNLDLISSHVNLSGLEVETANDSNRAFVLKEILNSKFKTSITKKINDENIKKRIENTLNKANDPLKKKFFLLVLLRFFKVFHSHSINL